MMRRTQTFLKVSPYFLFLQELSKAGKLKGVKAPGKMASKQYKELSVQKKAALVKRAKATSFPATLAYKRLAKKEMAHKNVPVNERYAALKQKWAAAKKAKKPKSAKSKVKETAKKNKKRAKKSKK